MLACSAFCLCVHRRAWARGSGAPLARQPGLERECDARVGMAAGCAVIDLPVPSMGQAAYVCLAPGRMWLLRASAACRLCRPFHKETSDPASAARLQVSLVINYDVPNNRELYIHRIGRSGRYGRKGVAINFVRNDDIRILRDIEQYYSTQIDEMVRPAATLPTQLSLCFAPCVHVWCLPNTCMHQRLPLSATITAAQQHGRTAALLIAPGRSATAPPPMTGMTRVGCARAAQPMNVADLI